MAGGSSKDLVYNIVSVSTGDGFKKTTKDADEAAAGLDRVGRKGEEVGAKKAKVDVETNADSAGEKLRQLGMDAGDTGTHLAVIAPSFDALHAKFVMLASAAVTLAPAMLAIPAALAGLGGALATIGGAFSGVTAALHDYGAESSAAGVSAAAQAQTAYSNAVALRNAAQAVADARRQANASAASSADSLTSAEERLANAEQSAQNAEQALTRARQDAARALESANEAAARGALDVRAATLALQDAQQQQLQIDQSTTASAEDRQKAQLAVDEAQQSLIETQNRANNAASDAAEANQKGVDGAQNVVDAVQAQKNALQSVGDAQRALAAAQRQAADQQIASAEAVQRAVQNLADTQKEQQLAAAAAASSGSAASSKFAADMAKLSPAAQQFVEKLISMRGGLDQLKLTAQTSLLPGFMPVLDGLAGLLPTINAGVQAFGTTIGGLASQFGTLMQNPAFKGQLATVFGDGAKLVGAFGQGFLKLLPTLMQVLQQVSPIIDALSGGFKVLLGSGLPDFLKGLAGGAGGAGQAISAIANVISHLLGPVGSLIGQLATALGPAFAALAPVLDQLITVLAGALGPILTDLAPIIGQLVIALVQDLTPIIAALAPIVDVLLQAFAQMMPVVLPLVQLIAGMFARALRDLMPVLMPLIPVILRIATIFFQIMMQVLTPLIPVIDTLTQTFVQLIPQLMPLIDLALQLFEALAPFIGMIVQLVATFLQLLIPALGKVIGWWAQLEAYIVGPVVKAVTGLIGTFTTIGKSISDAVKTAVGWIKDHWDDLIKTIEGLPGRMAKAAKGMWNWFGAELKTVINGVVIDSMNWVIRQINSLTGGLSDLWSWAGVPSIGTIDEIPHLARGATAISAGLALVGEKGPELVQLQAGARVISNPDSRAIAAELGAGGGAVNGQIEVVIRYPNGQEIDRQLVTWQRNGGESQAIRTGARRAMGVA